MKRHVIRKVGLQMDQQELSTTKKGFLGHKQTCRCGRCMRLNRDIMDKHNQAYIEYGCDAATRQMLKTEKRLGWVR